MMFYLQISYCQTNQNVVKEYFIEKNDTLIKIKLFSNNRVVLDKHPNKSFLKQKNKAVLLDEKHNKTLLNRNVQKLCTTQSIIYYSSYGKYLIKENILFMDFEDENPIENIEIIKSDTKENKNSISIQILKDFETHYDLFIFQNDIEISQILPFLIASKFTIEDFSNPLILKYNNYTKTIKLNSNIDANIKVSINDLKGSNYIKNQKIEFNISDLKEKTSANNTYK